MTSWKAMVPIHFVLYEMFMGPLDASIAWSTNGLDGARRFLRSRLAFAC